MNASRASFGSLSCMLAALLDADFAGDVDESDGAQGLPRLHRGARAPKRLPRSRAGVIRGRERGYVVKDSTRLKFKFGRARFEPRARERRVAKTVTPC